MVHLRDLEPTDSIEDLTALLHRAYARLAAMGLRYTATHQTPEVTRHRLEHAECRLAVDDGGIVGMIALRGPDATGGAPWYDRPDVAQFNQFAVEPDRQGTGIGGRLLAWAEERAAALGAAELACDTSEQAAHLIAMYDHLGYRFIEHVDWRPHVNYRSVILSKPLRPV